MDLTAFDAPAPPAALGDGYDPLPSDDRPTGVGPGRADDVLAAGVLLDVSRLLGGVLGLVRPPLGQRTEQLTRLVRAVAERLRLERPWEFEVAARLSQIGWLTLPAETHDAAWRGEPLSDEQWCAVASHPLIARDLLADVRRLEAVREMIARQREPFAVGPQLPAGGRDRLAVGGQLLRVCSEFVALCERGRAAGDALARLAAQPREFDPWVVGALEGCLRENDQLSRRQG